MRIVFLGSDARSVPALEAVASSGYDLAAVITRQPRPAGRGGSLRPTPVAEAARRRGLPLEETATVREGQGLERLRREAPDVLAVVAYGEILPPEVLETPRVAPVNVHFSLLPALRGADPVRRAILAGLEATGVTTIRMDEGLDTGPILLQAEEPIREEDDAGALGVRLAEMGGRLLVDTLDGLERGELRERPQDEARATSAPRLRPEEEWIVWTAPAQAVWRQVRALAPEPGARTRFRGEDLKVLRVRPVEAGGPAGSVLESSKDRMVVACGDGAVALEEVVPGGRNPMSGPEFARGRRPAIGELLG
ncbi:MAG: methionyl-tRNA formyltransferase [Actinomycetota bacterium]